MWCLLTHHHIDRSKADSRSNARSANCTTWYTAVNDRTLFSLPKYQPQMDRGTSGYHKTLCNKYRYYNTNGIMDTTFNSAFGHNLVIKRFLLEFLKAALYWASSINIAFNTELHITCLITETCYLPFRHISPIPKCLFNISKGWFWNLAPPFRNCSGSTVCTFLAISLASLCLVLQKKLINPVKELLKCFYSETSIKSENCRSKFAEVSPASTETSLLKAASWKTRALAAKNWIVSVKHQATVSTSMFYTFLYM